jgi:hypothetical protein
MRGRATGTTQNHPPPAVTLATKSRGAAWRGHPSARAKRTIPLAITGQNGPLATAQATAFPLGADPMTGSIDPSGILSTTPDRSGATEESLSRSSQDRALRERPRGSGLFRTTPGLCSRWGRSSTRCGMPRRTWTSVSSRCAPAIAVAGWVRVIVVSPAKAHAWSLERRRARWRWWHPRRYWLAPRGALTDDGCRSVRERVSRRRGVPRRGGVARMACSTVTVPRLILPHG